MSKNKRILCFILITICFIGFVLLCITILNDDEKDFFEKNRNILLATSVILMIVPAGIAVFLVATPVVAKDVAFAISYEARNPFWLRIYASKNEYYVFKYFNRGKGYRRDPRLIVKGYFKEIENEPKLYDENNIEFKLKSGIEIIDHRFIDYLDLFEMLYKDKTIYAAVSIKYRKYYMIILNKDEIAKRNEFNKSSKEKKKMSFKIVDFFDELFDKAHHDKREINTKYDCADDVNLVLKEIEKRIIE